MMGDEVKLCAFGDPFCPCQDGDACHYVNYLGAPAMKPPVTFIACGQHCDHDFKGWRNFEDGSGGEQVCAKCGIGAMAHSLWTEE